MYLFTRTRQIKPDKVPEGLAAVGEITASVRNVTGRELNAWAPILSPEMGSIVWAMWAETLAEIVTAGDQLAASADFGGLVARTSDAFHGPLVDGIASLVHGAPDTDAEPPEYVGVAIATAAPGHLTDAISHGVEIAEHVLKTTGENTLFTVNATGPYGGVSWITLSGDIAAVDAGQAALMADTSWLQLIDRAGPSYNSDASQSILRRIA
jgi:hypothetical protein